MLVHWLLVPSLLSLGTLTIAAGLAIVTRTRREDDVKGKTQETKVSVPFISVLKLKLKLNRSKHKN